MIADRIDKDVCDTLQLCYLLFTLKVSHGRVLEMQGLAEPFRDEYCVALDPARMDFDVIHNFLSNSYWSPGIPQDILRRAMAGSLCFGVFYRSEQVGFARVVTDKATFAYLCDVFVLEEHRGRGLGHRMMEAVVSHPDLQGLRRFVLVTRDAHRLYEKFGFQPLARPEGYMELYRPNVYACLPGTQDTATNL